MEVQSGKDSGSSEVSFLEDDTAGITSVTEIPRRRVRRRLHIGNQPNTSMLDSEHADWESLGGDSSSSRSFFNGLHLNNASSQISGPQISGLDVIFLDDDDDSECRGNPHDHLVLDNAHSARNIRDDFSSSSSPLPGRLHLNSTSSQISGPHVIFLDDDDDTEVFTLSTAKVYLRSLVNELSVIINVLNPTLQHRGNLLDHECPVNIVNREEQLENEVMVAATGDHEVASGDLSTAQFSSRFRSFQTPPSPATRARIDEIYNAERVERVVFPECYLPYMYPRMTISCLLSRLSIEDLIRNAGNSWNIENLTDEEVRLRIEGLLQKEQLAISEKIISEQLRTRAYSLPTSSFISEKSTSAGYLAGCNICMEKYKIGDRIAELYYCPHEFHADCIKTQLLERNVFAPPADRWH